MRYHHTKNKGDLGLVQAMDDLTAKGLVSDVLRIFVRVVSAYHRVVRGCEASRMARPAR